MSDFCASEPETQGARHREMMVTALQKVVCQLEHGQTKVRSEIEDFTTDQLNWRVEDRLTVEVDEKLKIAKDTYIITGKMVLKFKERIRIVSDGGECDPNNMEHDAMEEYIDEIAHLEDSDHVIAQVGRFQADSLLYLAAGQAKALVSDSDLKTIDLMGEDVVEDFRADIIRVHAAALVFDGIGSRRAKRECRAACDRVLASCNRITASEDDDETAADAA